MEERVLEVFPDASLRPAPRQVQIQTHDPTETTDRESTRNVGFER